MYIFWTALLLGLFAALLFVNFYFRWKVIRVYQVLINREIEFTLEHIFNRKKLQTEILPRYPGSEKEILSFVHYIHFSIKMASALLFLITLFGLILMYFQRHEG